MDEIKKLLEIKDGENFILDADEVAKITGKHRESIYASRKKDCKLDKLAIFEIIKELVAKKESNTIILAGDKDGVLNGLDGILKQDTRYKITIEEV